MPNAAWARKEVADCGPALCVLAREKDESAVGNSEDDCVGFSSPGGTSSSLGGVGGSALSN